MTWDQIINTGSTSWQLIKGQQAADLSSSSCNALPDVADWDKVSAAKGTNSGRTTLERKAAGRTVIDVEFDMFWAFGATYKNAGAFIPVCWFWVNRCNIDTDFDVDLMVNVMAPWNSGSAKAPNGVLEIHVSGMIATPRWSRPKRWKFLVTGSGAAQW